MCIYVTHIVVGLRKVVHKFQKEFDKTSRSVEMTLLQENEELKKQIVALKRE